VDSLTDEPLSHGFVSFSIDQLPNLPEGTQIKNQAAIFFDFNLPIYTNTWVHEIKENILPSAIIEEPPVASTSVVKIAPNPLKDIAQIEVLGADADSEIQLKIYDSKGILCRQTDYSTNVFQFNRNGLASGLYFIEVFNGDRIMERTKILIQY
jgi:hypothetical protein